jgi:hypothetical protein
LHDYVSFPGSIETASEKKEPCSVRRGNCGLYFWSGGEATREFGPRQVMVLEKLPSDLPVSVKFGLFCHLNFAEILSKKNGGSRCSVKILIVVSLKKIQPL